MGGLKVGTVKKAYYADKVYIVLLHLSKQRRVLTFCVLDFFFFLPLIAGGAQVLHFFYNLPTQFFFFSPVLYYYS